MGVILITGASRGIGKAVKEKFLQQGHQVEDLSRTSGYDLGNHFYNKFQHPKYNFLLLNAVTYSNQKLKDFSYKDFHYQLNVNLLGQIDLTRYMLATELLRPRASILVMGSTDIESLPPNQIPYNLSKQALETFALCLSQEIPQKVNCLRLGFTMTDLCDPSLPIPEEYWQPEEVAQEVFRILGLNQTGQVYRFVKGD